MNINPLEIYNSPKVADVWRMKEECHLYYVDCFKRLKKGEQFHPRGFARIDYSGTVRMLVRTLHFLGGEQAMVMGWKKLLRLHFNLHFAHVHVSLANWDEQYYISNFWEHDTAFTVYEVKGVLVLKEGWKKVRSVILDGNRVVPMNTATFLRQCRSSSAEQPMQPKFKRKDWQLALNREIVGFYCAENGASAEGSEAKILSFPPFDK